MAQMTGSSALGAVCGLLLLCSLASAARVGMNSSSELLVNAAPECGREVAEVPSEKTLQTYFDGLRRSYDILDESASFVGEGGAVDPEKCTKKDVCLLMRQLDMDFYERARKGLLQDADYETPPTKGWVMKGSCKEQQQTRGFKMVSVTDPAVCEAEAEAVGALFMGAVNSTLVPAGCIIVRKHGGKSKTAKAYLNENSTSDAEAGTSYPSGKKKESLEVLCEMDRSLSESAAAYYSPYKLKPSMHGREAHSTSCSFGMFAYLAKLRETMSPCAKILTYAAHQRFQNAEEALDMAKAYEKDGKAKEAQALKDYVESMRQKSVLMDVIANNWCPSIWTDSERSGGTCLAPRVMSWTAEHKALAKEEAEAKSAKAEKPKASRPKTRMEAAQRARGEKWGTTGNQGLINKVGALSGLKAEDEAGHLLLAARDADTAGSLDSWGKPIKSALTEEACPALDDESLAQLLAGKPQAPPNFFKDAAAAEP